MMASANFLNNSEEFWIIHGPTDPPHSNIIVGKESGLLTG